MRGELPQPHDTFSLVRKNVQQHNLAPHTAFAAVQRGGAAMHYYAYEYAHAVLSPFRVGVNAMRAALEWPLNPFTNTPFGRHLAAACEVFENVTRRCGKPEFGIKSTRVGNVEVPVRERVA